MATLDPSIYGRLRPSQLPVIPSPMEQYGQAMQLRSLASRGRLQDLQTQQVEQAMADEQAYRDAAREAGGDMRRLRDLLYQRGFPTRGMAVEKAITDRDKAALETDEKRVKLLKDRTAYLRDRLAGVSDQASYEAWVSEAAAMGSNSAKNAPPMFDPQWVRQQVFTADKFVDQLNKDRDFALKAANSIMIPSKGGGFTSNLPYIGARQSIGKSSAPSLHISGPLIPGKEAANKVDAGLLEAGGRMARLTRIEQAFRPEFLQIGTRAGATWSSVKEKLGANLGEEDRRNLTEFSRFKQEALANLNDYIKEITGAALSEAEAKRIMAAAPNPGQGMFDGDGPTEFKAKLDNTVRQVKMAEARYAYIKRHGFGIDSVPLERMPTLINQRGSEMETELKAKFPNMNDAERRKVVKGELAREFGLVSE